MVFLLRFLVFFCTREFLLLNSNSNIIPVADPLNFPSAERFEYLLDVLSSGSASDDSKPRHADTYTDQERYELTSGRETPIQKSYDLIGFLTGVSFCFLFFSSQALNLPESPFASPIVSGISTAI